MRSIDAHGSLLSPALDGAVGPSWQAGKNGAIVLIDRQPLTRQSLHRWLQAASPDRHVVSFASPADLLDASRSLSAPQIIIFSIGAASVGDAELLSKITLLRRQLSRASLVLLSRVCAALSRPASSRPKPQPPCNV